VVKVTEVSEGEGPAVSSRNTRTSGNTRGAAGVGLASGGGSRRPPQAQTAATAQSHSQVAPGNGCQDIVEVTNWCVVKVAR
jgi:hypothetical protein